MRTTVDKALHQVKRGRRKVTARDFNMEIRDRLNFNTEIRDRLMIWPRRYFAGREL